MIESLRIANVAIVEAAELEFEPGLNVLTGETGAGKSIVLGALALLVGGRASRDSVRAGADHASVEALFRTEGLAELEGALEALDLRPPSVHDDPDSPDAHELVVHRSLAAGGRSRARVGGQLVPVSTLAELLTGRVEISSQHSSQALRRPESHGRFLDAAGGLLAQRAAVSAAFEALQALAVEGATLRAEADERIRQQDFIAYQLAEIDEVGLAEGELAELETEHGRLAHAESLASEAGEALLSLRGDETGGEPSGAVDALARALRAIESMAEHDPAAGPWMERLAGADAELRDLALDLERYLDAIEGDPARLAALEDRIGQVERLRRKYGADEQAIFARREALAAELTRIEVADERLGKLEQEQEQALGGLARAAKKLTAGRKKAAGALAKEVEASLAGLAMSDARFLVEFEKPAQASQWPAGAASGPHGAESPEFRFSANKGEAPRPLQKVASGGELSRVFLALKGALRQAEANMVLVFDEVDAGIGGRAAERVGRALAQLAERHQVLCITHLPQIAVFAQRHFRVEKSASAGRVSAQIVQLGAEGRVEEIARMAGGEAISDATRAHARDLLNAAAP
ncbi:MAG: DNA repair protein RecN [Myxococcota bacterium]|nr:DNA repair protein RecN [Myxococcota bacterium]